MGVGSTRADFNTAELSDDVIPIAAFSRRLIETPDPASLLCVLLSKHGTQSPDGKCDATNKRRRDSYVAITVLTAAMRQVPATELFPQGATERTN